MTTTTVTRSGLKHPWAKSLQAAMEAGEDARRDNVGKRAGWERFEDDDLRHAWRVGWDKADAELRESA